MLLASSQISRISAQAVALASISCQDARFRASKRWFNHISVSKASFSQLSDYTPDRVRKNAFCFYQKDECGSTAINHSPVNEVRTPEIRAESEPQHYCNT
jgi:hypothetical protein